jgi:hypothetical protein
VPREAPTVEADPYVFPSSSPALAPHSEPHASGRLLPRLASSPYKTVKDMRFLQAELEKKNEEDDPSLKRAKPKKKAGKSKEEVPSGKGEQASASKKPVQRKRKSEEISVLEDEEDVEMADVGED